jgi:hypothetical protein
MKNAIIKVAVSVLVLCALFGTASAQSFKVILNKLERLEVKLNVLQSKQSEDVSQLAAMVKKIEPVQLNSNQDPEVKDLQKKLTFVTKQLGDLSVKTKANTDNLAEIKSEKKDNGSNENLDALIADLKPLVSDLRIFYENEAAAEPETESAKEETSVVQNIGGLNVNLGVDIMSRYIWRGLLKNNAPSIQPNLSVNRGGFTAGFFGAYTFSNSVTTVDENDFWVQYSKTLSNLWTITAKMTDYYYPMAGKQLFNFNDSDNEEGPGAHVLEAGVVLNGPQTFPVTLSVYKNMFNDAGQNMYYELAYGTNVKNTMLSFFAGATPGSTENPGYYGTDRFALINVGVAAVKLVKISDSIMLPFYVVYGMNPDFEISGLVVGISF